MKKKKKKIKTKSERERLLLPECTGKERLPELKEEEGRNRESVDGEGKTEVREGEEGKLVRVLYMRMGGKMQKKLKIELELKPNRVNLIRFPFKKIRSIQTWTIPLTVGLGLLSAVGLCLFDPLLTMDLPLVVGLAYYLP